MLRVDAINEHDRWFIGEISRATDRTLFYVRTYGNPNRDKIKIQSQEPVSRYLLEKHSLIVLYFKIDASVDKHISVSRSMDSQMYGKSRSRD